MWLSKRKTWRGWVFNLYISHAEIEWLRTENDVEIERVRNAPREQNRLQQEAFDQNYEEITRIKNTSQLKGRIIQIHETIEEKGHNNLVMRVELKQVKRKDKSLKTGQRKITQYQNFWNLQKMPVFAIFSCNWIK